MRAPISRSRRGLARAAWPLVQAFTILAMLAGMLAPLAPLASLAAAAQGVPLPPPLPAPDRVSLSGSFQTLLGCPADFDPSCPQTQLRDNRDGTWSAVLPVPPGDYVFRVVAVSDAERALGENGDPNGADLQLRVPDGAAGVYFRYDSSRGEITAEPVAAAAELITDLGEQLAMAPAPGGGYEITWDAQPGSYGFQVVLDGQPVTQDSVSLDAPSRVQVAVDDSGAVTVKQTVPETVLDVAATDAAGDPRPGSCFAILDQQGRLLAQACDDDDRQDDGFVRLRVPDGLADGDYTLRETFTPEGGNPAAEQRVPLGPGGFQAVAAAEGEAAPQDTGEQGAEQPAGDARIEPGERPGQLTVIPVDAANQPLPGACYAVVEFGFEVCDDDLDGTVVFDAVPASAVTLRETVPPAGFAVAADQTVDVPVTGARVIVPHAGGAEAQPAETEETPPVAPVETPQVVAGEGGPVTLVLNDRDGNPVLGACWALEERGGGATIESCDSDDGAEDGVITFPPVPEGRYRLEEAQTPAGFQPASGQGIDVLAGSPLEVIVEYGRTEGRPGRLIINVVDDRERPVAQTCFDLRGPIELTDVCDRQDDGRLNVPDLPAGEYVVSQTQTAEGFTAAAESSVAVPEDDTVEIQVINPRAGESGQQPVTPDQGRVVINVAGDDGAPVADACATLTGGEAAISFVVCDDREGDGNPEPGIIEIAAVAPGDYDLTVQPPAGFTAPEIARLTVVGGETARADIVLGAAATPETEPEAETETETAADLGDLAIRAENEAGELLPGACYTVELQGQPFGPFCDDNNSGVVAIAGIIPGPLTVVETTPPTGLPPAEPVRQDIEIVAGEEAEARFTRGTDAAQEAGDGAIDVSIVDDAGQPVTACVELTGAAGTLRVCDDEDGDEDDLPGLVLLTQVPAGTYSVALADLPEGMTAPAAQEVAVEAGQTAIVDFTVASAGGPGTLVLFVEDEEGNLLGGTCFTLESDAILLTDVCDQGDDGRLNVPDLPAGEYTITQTQAAAERQPAAEQTVTVAPGQTVEVTILNPGAAVTPTPSPIPSPTAEPSPTATAEAPTETPAATETPLPTETPLVEETPVAAETPVPGETGDVEFATFDESGNPVTDQCYTLAGEAGTFGPFCDNGEGDASGDPGVLVVQGLPSGTYEAVLESEEEITDADAELAQPAKQRRSVSVRRGNRPTRVDFNVRGQQSQRGSLLVRVRDENGNYLAGACFGLIPDGESAPDVEICDNRSDDGNTADGRILFDRMRPGRYTLTQTEAPDGYAPAADQSVRVQSRSVREVAVTNRAERERGANLNIETVDGEGNLLPGACYAILLGSVTTEACDADNGDDGITEFNGVAPGSYVVRQIQIPPGGFSRARDTAILLDPGESLTITAVNQLRPGSVLLRKTDEAGELLAGACFTLSQGERIAYSLCDNDASDGDNADGILLLGTVAPGTYILRETESPAGYLPAGDAEIVVGANQRTEETVVNRLAPRPERRGDLRIFKVDANGRALAGSCFVLIDGAGQSVAPRCDADDGADNGVILIAGVAPGVYTLRETRRPSADYQGAADVAVEVLENQTVEVQVVNRLLPGRILIRKFNPNGVPLQGACFDVVEDGAGAACTNSNGELLFSSLAPGVYTVVETQAPAGYLVAPELDPVTVRPGSTSTIDVVDQPAPPPPDSGSIQVVKFVCPAGEAGPGILFVDSSDPDGGGLAQTAGCNLGDATFSLDGPSGPLNFRTGAEGRFQTTLNTGDYVLTELSTGAFEELRVSVNTLTTVVVINYVAPPAPEPATIDVIKHTCAPGFQGRVWADFAAACLGGETLTNGVGFRISGPVSARRVTGDAGVGGVTQFGGLPAGDYRLREEVPNGTVAVYAFCGLDPDAPDGRAVGSALTLRLAAGQAVTCHWFNVPEDLAGDTGAITVYKYACPVTIPPGTFDWYGRCDPQGQGVRFSLSIWDGAQFQAVSEAATDGDGILRFTRLQPGTYELKEVGATWCHAESDSVNAQGNVVVTAGQRASVWIFNCVGAKNPPNTGAGPLWAGGAGPGVTAAGAIGAGMLWPVLGFAALHLRRRRAA